MADKRPTNREKLNEITAPDPDISADALSVDCNYIDGDLLPLSKDRALELLERDLTVYYGMIDGIINNGPRQQTVAELEQQAQSGQPISLNNGVPARS